ncbi:hypothetical protein CDD83_10977 [Cordyceps sp. RAO-2017]|nr:hypothetical protein CDD83_10977 [Cordyceps sp. RAO-2017]
MVSSAGRCPGQSINLADSVSTSRSKKQTAGDHGTAVKYQVKRLVGTRATNRATKDAAMSPIRKSLLRRCSWRCYRTAARPARWVTLANQARETTIYQW